MVVTKVYVDPDLCISCGDCIDICPDVFDWDDDGLSKALTDTVPEGLEDEAHEAVEACPTDAIQEEGFLRRQVVSRLEYRESPEP